MLFSSFRSGFRKRITKRKLPKFAENKANSNSPFQMNKMNFIHFYSIWDRKHCEKFRLQIKKGNTHYIWKCTNTFSKLYWAENLEIETNRIFDKTKPNKQKKNGRKFKGNGDFEYMIKKRELQWNYNFHSFPIKKPLELFVGFSNTWLLLFVCLVCLLLCHWALHFEFFLSIRALYTP